MEVQTGGLIAEIIGKVYSDLFTDIRSESWRGPLPINCDYWPLVQAIRILGEPTNIPIVRSSRHADAVNKKVE